MLIARFLLLLASIGFASSLSFDVEKVEINAFWREKVMVLQPESVFRNFFENNKGDWELNEECAKHLRWLEEDLKIRQPWALKMLDASSTGLPGLLQGNVIELGMFDECLKISENKSVGINGRHCMYTILLKKPRKYEFPVHPTLSICLPSSCSENDLQTLLNEVVQRNEMMKQEIIVKSSCTNNEPRVKDAFFWIATLFLAAYVGFVILCTSCDLLNRWFEFDEEKAATLCKLSFLRASKKILSTETHKDDIPSIHGIRVISTVWVMLLHGFFVPLLGANVNSFDLNKWLGTWTSMFMILGINCVDTFFVLSGFLMTYTFFKRQAGEESFNVLYHYAHRYLRLTLPIAAVVSTSFISLAYPLSGALYQWLENIMFVGVRTKWWSFFMYIQNFVEPTNRCLQHLWSMAVDMQLFLISPLILYPLSKKPKIGLTILVLLTLTSMASCAMIIGFNEYSAAYFDHLGDIQRTMDEFDAVYVKPYTRASPWLIGIALAYKLIRDQQESKAPSKMDLFAGWLLMIFSLGFNIFGLKSLIEMDYDYDLTWEIIYGTFARPLWAFSVCWLIYASYHGGAGPISRLLSWKGFVPLSKLSYCVYLVHLLFPFIRIATTRTNSLYADYVIMHAFLGDVVLSIVLAFILSAATEVPMQVLDNLIFKKKKK